LERVLLVCVDMHFPHRTMPEDSQQHTLSAIPLVHTEQNSLAGVAVKPVLCRAGLVGGVLESGSMTWLPGVEM
jgi:hypothetical protein